VVSTAQPWWRAAGGTASVTFKGTEATGGLSQALALVTLAGTLLVLVLTTAGRRVVALLLAAVGTGTVLVGALRLRPTRDAVRTRMREVSLIDQYALTPTNWPWIFAVAGLVVACGSVLLWVGAPHWSLRPDRFERGGAEPALPGSDDPAGVWRALDAGLDPTAEAEGSDTPPLHDPDVRIGEAGDTMGPKKTADPS
jgi:uncharacterized membrane protein (TIGR02234 family)